MKTLILVVLAVAMSQSTFSRGGVSSVGPRTQANFVSSANVLSDPLLSSDTDSGCPIIRGRPCCNPWYCGGGV